MLDDLWGRPRWIWFVDAGIVVSFTVVGLLTEQPLLRLLLLAVAALRLVLAVVVTVLWRMRMRRDGPSSR